MKEIHHHGAPVGTAHYSAAVRDGDHLYISGQLPLDPVTRKFCEGGIREQTLQALSNLEALIMQEGGSRKDVLRTTAYIANMENWGAVNDTYREFFGDHKPARTIVAASEIHFGFLIEIDGIAVVSK